MARQVQQRTIESRKKLLKAAYEMFSEKGYYQTNTKEIVRRAGISIGNFYNYYKDKGDIYYVLLEMYYSDSAQAMQALLNEMEKRTEREECKAFLLSNLEGLLERSEGMNQFFDDAAIIAKENERIRELKDEANARLVAILEDFLKRRYPKKQDNFYVRARMLYVFTDWVAQDISRVGDVGQRQDYIQMFADEIIRYAYDL